MFQLVWLAIIVLFVVISFKMATDDEFVKNWIKWGNELRGVKTNITPKTIRWAKFTGIASMIGGAIMILSAVPYIFR